MFISSKRVAALGLALTALVVTGCGSDDEKAASTPAASESTDAAAPAGKKIKVGLVTDIGGLNDRSFNALANKGLEDAKTQLGVDGRVITSKSNSDYIPNLSSLAQQKYDLIIGVGFLMADAVDTVANKTANNSRTAAAEASTSAGALGNSRSCNCTDTPANQPSAKLAARPAGPAANPVPPMALQCRMRRLL